MADITTEITIRQATLQDAKVIAHHRRAMFADMGMGTPAQLDEMEATFTRYVRRALSSGLYLGWLACLEDGQVVAGGGLIAHEWPTRPGDPNMRRAYILNVYTEPAFRQRGLARRIMTDILDWCRAQGFKTVSLHASKFGRSLYEDMGFEPTNEMRLKL
jgi:GNAT superfamily N-acetyltransferase